MRVLVVEDDEKIGSFIQKGLEMERFVVDRVDRGDSGLEMALGVHYDLIVLDIVIPGLDGFEFLTRLRSAGSKAIVIAVTARDEVDDRIRGLDLGADDYLVKPFSFAELLARIRAHSRRQGDAPSVLELGSLVLDRVRQRLTRDGTRIELSPREFQLLNYFMQNPGQTLTRAMIADRVWGHQFDTGTNVIDVYVAYLRKKIDSEGPSTIQSVRGVGYRFDP